jgi:hypothetical protein
MTASKAGNKHQGTDARVVADTNHLVRREKETNRLRWPQEIIDHVKQMRKKIADINAGWVAVSRTATITNKRSRQKRRVKKIDKSVDISDTRKNRKSFVQIYPHYFCMQLMPRVK